MEERVFLQKKRLCFNCAGSKHRAAECTSKLRCTLYSWKHHTSICPHQQPGRESALSSLGDDKVIYPVVVVTVDGTECRALLDSGSSSCYTFAKLLDILGKRPTAIKPRRVEMLKPSSTARMEIYKTTVFTRSGDFSLDVTLSKVTG